MKRQIVTSWHNIFCGTMIDHIYIGTYFGYKTDKLSVGEDPAYK